MMHRKGFTIIELLIAFTIASLLTGALLTSFFQSNRLVNSLDDYMDIYATVLLVDQQLCKDLAGAFIPRQAIAPPKQKKQEPAQGQAKEASQKEAKKKPLLKDPFVARNKDGQLSMLSFITNNPMRVYVDPEKNEPKPLIVRVVYTLDGQTLYRQEDTELDLQPYTSKDSKIERYALAENVKNIEATFVATEQGEPKEGAQPEPEQKTFDDWQVGSDEKDLRSKVKLPDVVEIELELWDARKKRSRSFSLSMPILAGYQEPKPDAAQQAQPAAAQQKKKEILVSGANSIMQNVRRVFG